MTDQNFVQEYVFEAEKFNLVKKRIGEYAKSCPQQIKLRGRKNRL